MRFACYFFVSCWYSSIILTVEGTLSKPKDVSIIVLGLSGAGVSSTVAQIINGPINKTDVPTVFEYSWNVQLTDGEKKIRIAATPGMVGGKTDEQDAEILSTIKAYLESPAGLNGSFPSIIIIVSRFDDKRAGGENSQFVKMLKRVGIIENLLLDKKSPSNIIFHFSYLMSVTKTEQRRPRKQIEFFHSIIGNYTKFPPPIYITLGENKPDEYGLPRSEGYAQLPNKDLFPKNIIDYMKHILTSANDTSGYQAIQEAFQNGDSKHSPTVRAFTNADLEDSGATTTSSFLGDVVGSQYNVQDTEVSRALEEAFQSLDDSLKTGYPKILQILQLTFQNQLNIKMKSELPKTTPKIVEMFQALPHHMASLSIIKEAFQLNQPVFYHPLIVGHGYDIMKDESIYTSPYVIDNYQPTALGYSLPDIFSCQMEDKESEVVNFKIFDSVDDYPEIRMNDLELGNIMNKTLFSGQLRHNYNIRPKAVDDFVGLKATKEFRGFTLELMQSAEVTQQFKDDLNALKPFNQSNKDSPEEWKSFFRKYGSHIVSTAYGGGYMEATASGDALRDYFGDSTTVNGVKNALVDFHGLPSQLIGNDISFSHYFFGGSPNSELRRAYYLSESERSDLLKDWTSTIKLDPRILEMHMRLIPIDEVVMSVNNTIGYNVKEALNLLLQGNLKYVRRTSRPPVRTTPKNSSTTATTYPYFGWTQSSTTTSYDTYDHTQGRQADTPPSNTCPLCPQIVCPTLTAEPEPIKACPINIAPTEAATAVKFEDYTANTVGQGYNLLKDIVLPTSPFKLEFTDKLGLFVPVLVSVTKMEVCSFRTFKVHDSLKHYVRSKYKTLLPNLASYYYPAENRYDWTVRTGHTVLNNSANPRLSLLEEKRYYKLQLSPAWSRLDLTESFLNDLSKLPQYGTETKSLNNCTVLTQWDTFLEKYGTHIITEGYAGTINEGYVRGYTQADAKTVYGENDSSECAPLVMDYVNMYPTLEKPVVSVESATFMEINDVMQIARPGLRNLNSIIMTLLNKREKCFYI